MSDKLTEAEAIDNIIAILKTVPPKSLMLIEIANEIRFKDGAPDFEQIEAMQPEIKLAVQEASVYGGHTIMMVEQLSRMDGSVAEDEEAEEDE